MMMTTARRRRRRRRGTRRKSSCRRRRRRRRKKGQGRSLRTAAPSCPAVAVYYPSAAAPSPAHADACTPAAT
jgi:hypothetical protein